MSRATAPLLVTSVRSSPLSLPRRVANALREAIRDGSRAIGERLPMETVLAEQLGVSRATLREGLRILESEGLIVRRGGVGTFVAPAMSPIRSGIERLYGITEFIRRAGYTPGLRDLRLTTASASPDVARALGLDSGASILHLSRTYTADDRPVIQCEDDLPEALVSASADLASLRGEISLYDLLRERCGLDIRRAVATIIPILPDARLAGQLEVDRRQPLLVLEQVHYVADGRAVLLSRNTHDSRAIEFQVLRMREW